MEFGFIKTHIVEGVLLAKGRTKDTSHVDTRFRGYQKFSLYSSLILQVELLPQAYQVGELTWLL